ncbi:MAG: glycosyltransferase family 2 protein [Oscillospiraceae bacterium]|nr:glycosyltransferase family 2 protein [Oscillospiraceae bacterium]
MNWLIGLGITCLILSILTSVMYSYQMFYLILPFFAKPKALPKQGFHKYAILIAARNEELVLPHLLDSIANQDYPAEKLRIFVVADNCTDSTAAVAGAHGATVFCRNNQNQIGKGYALDYLLERIDTTEGLDSFDAFLVFDADNLLQPDYIRSMDRVHSNGYQVFCGYRNTKNFGTNWLTSGYGLWYIHESTHLNRSRMHIGTGCTVSGTGFGFSREVLLKTGGWKFFTLTEDLEFSAWCATNGIKIGYCHDAVLYDEQPITFRQSWRQRTRWAQGGIQMSLRYIARLLKGIFTGKGWVRFNCFETTSLSLFGFLFGMFCMLLTLLFILLAWGPMFFLQISLLTFPLSYLGTVLMAALTLALEWDRIRATKKEKIVSMLTFPFFMMTWLPITLAAPFQKFGWPPIYHTVATTAESLK